VTPAPTLLAVLALVVVVQALRWWPVYRNVAAYRTYWRRHAEEPGELLYVTLGGLPGPGHRGVAPGAQLHRAGGTRGAAAGRARVAIGANDGGRIGPDAFRGGFETLCAALPAGSLVADVARLPARARTGMRRDAVHSGAREVLAGHPELVPVALEAPTAHLGWRDYAADFFHPAIPATPARPNPSWMHYAPPVRTVRLQTRWAASITSSARTTGVGWIAVVPSALPRDSVEPARRVGRLSYRVGTGRLRGRVTVAAGEWMQFQSQVTPEGTPAAGGGGMFRVRPVPSSHGRTAATAATSSRGSTARRGGTGGHVTAGRRSPGVASARTSLAVRQPFRHALRAARSNP